MPTILRALSLSELLDRTFSIYRNHFALFVGIAALPQLVLLALNLAGIVFIPTPMAGHALGTAGFGLWALLTAIVGLLVGATISAGTVAAVSAVYLDQPITVGGAYRQIQSRIIPVMLITIGVSAGVGLGLMLLIIPGIIFALMWSLTIPVAVIERKGMKAATKRSAELTKGDRGRIFVVCLVIGLLVWVVSILLNIPSYVLMGLAVRSQNLTHNIPLGVASSLAQFFSYILVGPLFTIALSLLYYDERVRKEAFDLQMMVSTLEGESVVAVPVGAAE